MATKIYDHITIDGDDAKLDASLIENLDNNQELAALKEDLSGIKNILFVSEEVDYSLYSVSHYYISPSRNVWATNVGANNYFIPIDGVDSITVVANSENYAIIAILASSTVITGDTPIYADGWTARTTVSVGESQTFTVPSNGNFLWIMKSNSTTDFTPDSLILNKSLDGKSVIDGIETLKSYHPNYSGKKMSILGDSISTFVPTADKVDGKAPAGCTTTYPGNATQYENSDVTAVSATWWGKVLNQYGMELGINESWAGSCIGYNPDQTNGGKYTADNCLCSETRIGHLGENGTPDLIIVFGGTNDINHHRAGNTDTLRYAVGELDTVNNPYDFENFPMVTDTYYGSITTMLLRIQHTYPNATILMILPYFCTYTHTSSGDIATPQDQNTWCNVAIDVCKFLGVDYLDLRTIINLYDVSTLLFDGLHPKANGMDAIAKAVIHKLNNML